MKKYLFALLAFAVIGFAACTKDDDKPSNNKEQTEPEKKTIELAGSIYKTSADESMATGEIKFISATEGSLSVVVAYANLNIASTFTYSVEDSVITIIPAVTDQGMEYVLTDGKMTATIIGDGEAIKIPVMGGNYTMTLYKSDAAAETYDVAGQTFKTSEDVTMVVGEIAFLTATEGHMHIVVEHANLDIASDFTYTIADATITITPDVTDQGMEYMLTDGVMTATIIDGGAAIEVPVMGGRQKMVMLRQ